MQRRTFITLAGALVGANVLLQSVTLKSAHAAETEADPKDPKISPFLYGKAKDPNQTCSNCKFKQDLGKGKLGCNFDPFKGKTVNKDFSCSVWVKG